MDRPCANHLERTSDLIFFQHHPLQRIYKNNTHVVVSERCALFELKETITALFLGGIIYLSPSCPTRPCLRIYGQARGVIIIIGNRRAAILISIYARARVCEHIIKRDYALSRQQHMLVIIF